MPLELHILGPAFSLPSIDPQCIAAVAYFTQTVPRGEWILVASSDPTLSPTNELPALRSDNVWVGGFRNIVDYVAQFSNGKWALDTELEGRGKADCIAFSAFVESHGQSLLDLSLYVSTQNYSSTTRPIYSTIQPFPLPYFTPSSIRSAARSRTSHLGLSSLDIDSDPSADIQKEGESIIPSSLRTPKNTISSLLSQSPEKAAQIRLDSLATSFFEPLQSLRSKRRFFVSQGPTSLDCLAIGYLSLALLPDLPSPWLASCMRKKFPQLCAFVHDLQKSFFGGSVGLEDAYLVPYPNGTGGTEVIDAERRRRVAGKGALPWSPRENEGIMALGGTLVGYVADSIPLVSQFRETTRLKRELESVAEDEDDLHEVAEVVSIRRRELWTTAASVVAGIGVFVGFMVHFGLLNVIIAGESHAEGHHNNPHMAMDGENLELEDEHRSENKTGEEADGNEQQSSLQQFGYAGAALEVLAQQMAREGLTLGEYPPAPVPPPTSQPQEQPQPLDVDIEVELVDRVH